MLAKKRSSPPGAGAARAARALNDFALAPHFRLYEFECRCCGRAIVASALPGMLEELRGAWGRPLAITSGYRCASHNAAVGGAPRSLHMAGRAVDIRASVSEQAELKKLAWLIGFYEILLGNIRNYIHLACK